MRWGYTPPPLSLSVWDPGPNAQVCGLRRLSGSLISDLVRGSPPFESRALHWGGGGGLTPEARPVGSVCGRGCHKDAQPFFFFY